VYNEAVMIKATHTAVLDLEEDGRKSSTQLNPVAITISFAV
jgi:hypothetical protein